jgi:hypothetical protein
LIGHTFHLGPDFTDPSNALALMFVNRQLSAETAFLVYSMNTFVILTRPVSWMQTWGDQVLQYFMRDKTDLQVCKTVLKLYTNL